MARRPKDYIDLSGLIKKVRKRHHKIKLIHFTTHMIGKLFLGLGIGTYFFDSLQPYVIVFIAVGLLLHVPFWYHIYFRK